MNNTLINDTAWTQRYESLRQHFLGGSGRLQSAPLGLLLFIREGLAAWMRGWNQEPAVSVQPPNCPIPMLPLPATSGWQRELTFLLAQMTALHLQPTSTG